MIWRRPNRRVRLQMKENLPAIEGVLRGCTQGHYLVLAPRVWHTAGEQPAELKHAIEVPRENVAFYEVLA